MGFIVRISNNEIINISVKQVRSSNDRLSLNRFCESLHISLQISGNDKRYIDANILMTPVKISGMPNE